MNRLRQADLRNLAWSSSVGLSFNDSKGKMKRITGKLNPVIASFEMNNHALGISTEEGVVISDNFSRDKQVCAVCLKSNNMLGNTKCIKHVSVRRSIYLTLVRSHQV